MTPVTIILLCLLLIGFGQDDNVEGDWIYKGKEFKNTLNLKKIDSEENMYNFSFDCLRKQYCNLLKDTTKFFGSMEGESFVIKIKDNKAHYNDEVQEFEEGWEIYNEGEKRCNVYFTFKQNEITIKTELCNMMYGGFGVSFDGKYIKQYD